MLRHIPLTRGVRPARSIRDLSQYQEEVEYLWIPCSFLELSGTKSLEVTRLGVVEVIPVSERPLASLHKVRSDMLSARCV